MTNQTSTRRFRSERGQALLETTLTLPIILLVSVAIFEFGRAYQTWQVLTNAAREGARVSVLPGMTVSNVQSRVKKYMEAGQLSEFNTATIDVNRSAQLPMGAGTVSGSIVTVSYPFKFVVLNPLMQLVVPKSEVGKPITMTAAAQMRNESPF
jgi:Flp pilus assembly protein TadG